MPIPVCIISFFPYLCTRLGSVVVPLCVVDLGAVRPESLLSEGGELRGGRHLVVLGRGEDGGSGSLKFGCANVIETADRGATVGEVL